MSFLDISRSISPATAVWPGDQSVEWTWTSRLGQEDAPVNLGAIRMSTHTGTHVDAPLHVSDGGRTTGELPLSVFAGPVDVVAVPDEPAVRPEHVTDVTAERVLFKTSAGALSDDKWPDSITPIDAETARALSSQGVVLVGTDAPSVDPLDSTALPAHHALLGADIVNLEGLRLGHVPAGRYYLMAFPLKLSAADAAPVRAVLADAAPE